MRVVLVLLLAFDFEALWQRMTRDTSSRAATRRGEAQYAKKEYAESAKSFDKAHAIAPSADSAFNLGTAEIASGKRAEGSATLGKAMLDPKLRADALYNRGNSALAANAHDHAIRDFTEALKLRPNDPAAKRNLEIALNRKRSAQRPQSGGNEQQPSAGGQQPRQAPSQGQGQQQQTPREGGTDADALLRSVQQQEQEERERMRRPREARGRVGW